MLKVDHPLQSKEWKNFREAWGNKVLQTKYGIITIHKLPLIDYSVGIFEKGGEPTKTMVADLKKVARAERIVFIKLEPSTPVKIWGNPAEYLTSPRGAAGKTQSFVEKNTVPGKSLFTQSTFWIDLAGTEDEIFQKFTSKTRYNIRLAAKKGVVVKEDNSPSAFERYLDLTFETTKRQGFYAHNRRYHRLMWKYLHEIPVANGKKPIAHLLTAVYKKEIITAWIVFTYKKFLYYPYGASTNKYKDVMANNLMMWEAIKFGKEKGMKIFDLWGREEGKGFTKFKEGYNPMVVEFLGSRDLVVFPALYRIYRIADGIRWKLLKIQRLIFRK